LVKERINPEEECSALLEQLKKWDISTEGLFPNIVTNIDYLSRIEELKASWMSRWKPDDSLRLDCLLFMRQTSIVEIKPAGLRFNVIKQRLRTSFTSQLAMFGKESIK